MHELAIANSVLDAVQKEAQLRSGMRIAKVGLRVGDLAGVDQDALSFCLEVEVKHSALEPTIFEIERCPQRRQCSQCDNTFTVVNYDPLCPNCGGSNSTFLSGDELELAYQDEEDI
jgi:hydrogenase nickel incorporation protein HypA/HybF